MKKYILVMLTALICASTINYASAKTTSNTSLASAIKMYKAGNYSQCYDVLSNIVKKDPSNAVAYYYLAMTSAQIGKKDEAITNYEKVITLTPNSQVGLYASKGKTCLEAPDKCNEESETSALDNFVCFRVGCPYGSNAFNGGKLRVDSTQTSKASSGTYGVVFWFHAENVPFLAFGSIGCIVASVDEVA